MHTIAKGRSPEPRGFPSGHATQRMSLLKHVDLYSRVPHFLSPSLLLASENSQRGHFSSSTSRIVRLSFSRALGSLNFLKMFLLLLFPER